MKNIRVYFLLFLFLGLTSCKKFLDAKPDSTLATLNTMDDVQSVLDYFSKVNVPQINCMDNSSDDFYLSQATYDSFSYAPYLRAQYTWQNSGVFGLPAVEGGNTWASAYAHIYQANTVLEKIERVSFSEADHSRRNDIQGQGYFLRGYTYLQMIWTWGKGYNSVTAGSDLGLPLRLSTDFNQFVPRSSVEQSYFQVINDLKFAIRLLPDYPATARPTRPGKAAAYGALARAYLSMRDYNNCLTYADSSLRLKSDLLDYNSVVPNSSQFTFQEFQVPEVSYEGYALPEIGYFGLVDPGLFNSYADNDLRKKLFFRVDGQGAHFIGSYSAPNFFSGLACDEVFLMRAECYARKGDASRAMADLNTLLKYRIDKSSFVPLTASSSQQALTLILNERRKELLGRELRWMDLKRLNLEGANITITRLVSGQTYKLAPNSLRYAMPIPDDVLSLAGIEQNPY